MSDLGDAGGEVLGLFIGIPMAIVCVIALPFVAIEGCSNHFKEKKQKVERVAKVYDVLQNPKETKESLSFRAGQKIKESSKDFVRGVFTKKTEK